MGMSIISVWEQTISSLGKGKEGHRIPSNYFEKKQQKTHDNIFEARACSHKTDLVRMRDFYWRGVQCTHTIFYSDGKNSSFFLCLAVNSFMQFGVGFSQANMRNKLAVKKQENNCERNEFEIKCSSEQT